MIWFAIASLTPAVLLIRACLAGGVWPLMALISITGFVLGMDRLAQVILPVREDDTAARQGRALSLALAVAHFVVLPLGVWTIAQAGHLGGGQKAMIALALGLFLGQVSNPNAHELIHSPSRWPRRLGVAIYISMLFGHHASAHPKVHHVHVATDNDPNSARRGESFYRFWPRAWIGSFRAGLAAENAARARRSRPVSALGHPYVAYCAGAVLTMAVAVALAGATGAIVWLGLAGYAQMQLLLADYVQHYGLRRERRPDGTVEPAGLAHSWNAPHWYSAAMMLNAPHHSDHHMHPLLPFPALKLDRATMPMLPHPMMVMGFLAMIPPVWRRLMDPRARDWRQPAPEGSSGQNPPLARD